jgi:transcriptional regulator with XRE-family HTH domain
MEHGQDREGPRPPAAPEAPLTCAQCRAARALLGWSRARHAGFAGLSDRTLRNFEEGGDASRRSLIRLREALVAAGVEFGDEQGDGTGVRLRAAPGAAACVATSPGQPTAAQCREARALLGWTIGRLACSARVSWRTVRRLERGDRLAAFTLGRIRAALEAAGIAFAGNGTGAAKAERTHEVPHRDGPGMDRQTPEAGGAVLHAGPSTSA